MICRSDREIITVWASMEEPTRDLSTLQYATTLCVKLLAEIDELHAILATIGADE